MFIPVYFLCIIYIDFKSEFINMFDLNRMNSYKYSPEDLKYVFNFNGVKQSICTCKLNVYTFLLKIFVAFPPCSSTFILNVLFVSDVMLYVVVLRENKIKKADLFLFVFFFTICNNFCFVIESLMQHLYIYS